MNYSQLSLKELIHYGELDARSPLELALVAALADLRKQVYPYIDDESLELVDSSAAFAVHGSCMYVTL
jgi:hypothetical protein